MTQLRTLSSGVSLFSGTAVTTLRCSAIGSPFGDKSVGKIEAARGAGTEPDLFRRVPLSVQMPAASLNSGSHTS